MGSIPAWTVATTALTILTRALRDALRLQIEPDAPRERQQQAADRVAAVRRLYREASDEA